MTLTRRAAAAALLALAAGCAKPGDGVPGAEVTMTVRPDPPAVGPASIELRMRDAQGPLAGATVKVEGNMAHAGMRPSLADARETAPGSYRADLELTMAGDWFVLVDATLPDGRRLERKLDLRGVRPK